ncbi:MAG: trypsin-like peptidase domain-containing protein [Oscillospiraceae bacterium]|nr:trypsin-like peptidase domain-containing protein [Oscillospiraceae bacterium]MBP3672649.1 trypsin-like peptidase domain-containing protein [Oscillospiraceae bacterium]MBP3674817.1 trypsin-like peptidase domain-containing protein [Oscillospiraceae bacterium]MDD6856702.1 trypsin-like peptidase domain-containing protein [Oscillospiraceae bacterium]MDY2558766.1 trypsin-like peptidase domain-containing protein [Candidatus Faecousia sp.]
MSEYFDDSLYETSEQKEAPTEQMPQMPSQKKHKKSGAGKAVALVLVCALVSGCMGVGGAFLGSSLVRQGQPETVLSDGVSTVMKGVRETSVLQIQQIDSSKTLSAAEVYAANVNSTVGIVTSAVTTNFWGQRTTSAAAGSGFLFTDDGYILTNYHVVQGADSVTVSTYDGTKYDAKIIGFDESNDVAVLKIDAEGLTPVVIGNSDQLNVGDSVVAIGNPLGELTFSLTSGTVSALDREVTMSSGISMELIQTDCAINSGNSGGALFNMHGEVVGITNAKYSGSSGSGASIDNIAFAIPINDVYSIVTSIIEKGYIEKPYIGVSVLDVSDETQKYGLPKGASVQTVTDDGPAKAAGLQVNDIITKVDDTEITGSSDLVKTIGQCKPGQEITLTVYRQGQTLELKVTVARKVQDSKPEQQTVQQQTQSSNGYSGQIPNFPGFFGFGF